MDIVFVLSFENGGIWIILILEVVYGLIGSSSCIKYLKILRYIFNWGV